LRFRSQELPVTLLRYDARSDEKPVRPIGEPEQKAPRADRPPTEGFVVIVDGRFKSEFETAEAAELSGRKLKSTSDAQDRNL
jgi:hypothetical protein